MDARALAIGGEIDRWTQDRLLQHESQGSVGDHHLSQIEEREVFLEAVGGVRKGRVYGLGSHGPAMFPEELGNRASSSSTGGASGVGDELAQLRRDMEQLQSDIEARVEARLQAQVEAQVEARVEARLQALVDAQVQVRVDTQVEARLQAQLQEQMREFFAALTRTPSPTPRTPDDPSGPSSH